MNSTTFFNSLFSLTNKNALVTGGSSGIGRAIATALAMAGARVVLVARNEKNLITTTEELQRSACHVAYVTGDLGDRTRLAAIADQAVSVFGEPDILVTAAGINLRPALNDLSMDDWDRTMALNLEAPFLLGQRFGPTMAQRGWGRILHIASQQSIRAFGNSGAYGVSKTAITGLVRTQAEAWSPHGVCVNALGPAFVKTPLTAPVFSDPERSQAMAARTMVGRNGIPEDFVGITLALAGPAGAFITGQTIFVDGGFSAK